MINKNLFLSWLFVKMAIVGLLFVIFGCNYIFSDFWYDTKFDAETARRAILGAGSNIDKFDQFGYTALLMACAAGKTGTDAPKSSVEAKTLATRVMGDDVELLISKGADVNLTAKASVGDAPLHAACWNKNIGAIDLLLKNNANPLLKNKQNVTPFGLVIKVDFPEDFKKVLNMFLAQGVDINYPDQNGRSILFAVVDQTQADLLNVLQTEYAHLIDFDLKDKGYKAAQTTAAKSAVTIGQFAATKGDIQDRVKPLVFQQLNPSMSVNSYDPRYSFNKDFTLTMVAAIKGKEGYLADAIKNYNGDVNLQDRIYGNSSLHWALLYNRLKCVSVIVKTNKANTSLKNKAGKASIHCLWGIRSTEDRKTAAKLLSDFGANFNAQDNNGNTFLHNAVLWADVDFVKLIATDDYFVRRVNFNLKNNNGKTAFDLTQRFLYDQKYADIANLLRNYNNSSYVGTNDQKAGITALMLACMRGDQVSAKQLISQNTVNQKDKSGDTPLHFAIRSRSTDIAKMLIVAGAKVDEKNNLGDTPLNEVINIFDKDKREEIAKLLLEKGSGIVENKNGENIMHLAVRKKMPDLILFLKQNLGRSEKNKEGKTAYDLAKEIGQKEDMKDVLNALEGIAPKK
jgi:FOG: Ankyrin repeat